jgi:hypothetical protein
MRQNRHLAPRVVNYWITVRSWCERNWNALTINGDGHVI